MEDHQIVSEVAKRIFNDRSISQPIYCPEIKTEAEAERMADRLPLIYVWNEDPTTYSCSISINGGVITKALESYLPMDDPRFNEIRDSLLALFQEIGVPIVLRTCEELQAPASVAFSKEVYELAMK